MVLVICLLLVISVRVVGLFDLSFLGMFRLLVCWFSVVYCLLLGVVCLLRGCLFTVCGFVGLLNG